MGHGLLGDVDQREDGACATCNRSERGEKGGQTDPHGCAQIKIIYCYPKSC